MSSLITNSSAMIALQTLRSINSSLDETNNRVSTGLRVNSAADNAAYWSIATTTRSDNGALSAVKDALGLGLASVDTANTGLDTVRTALQKIKEKLVTASAPDADRAKLQTEITSLLYQMRSTADSSVISGSNWLSVDSSDSSYNAVKSVVSSFSRTGESVKVETIEIDTSTLKLYDDNATVHSDVDAALTTGLADYNTAKTTADTDYDTAIADADTDYGTAVADAETQYGIDNDLDAYNTALAAAETARDAAYTTALDTRTNAYTAASTSLATALDIDGNSSLGVFDKVRVATAENGEATASSIADIDIGALTASESDLAQISNFMSIVDAALLDLTDASTQTGALTSRIESQESFVKALMDANDRAIGTLVDANMEEESTRLKALQTQQQLAIQSLGIANATSQNILALFQN